MFYLKPESKGFLLWTVQYRLHNEVNVNIMGERKWKQCPDKYFLSLSRKKEKETNSFFFTDTRHCLWIFTSGRSMCQSCHNPSSSPRRCWTQTLLHGCHFSVENRTRHEVQTKLLWRTTATYSGEALRQIQCLCLLTKDHGSCERNTALYLSLEAP